MPRRVSATELLDEAFTHELSWCGKDTTKFTGILAERDVDFLDVSSGGGHPKAIMKGGPAYQMPFAQAIKQAVVDKLAIGSFTDGKISQEVLDKVQANVIL